MGIFKRKKEETNLSKPVVIVVELLLAIAAFLCAIGIKWLVANKYNPKIVRLEDQVVEGITFSDFKIDYSSSKAKLTVNAINYTEEIKTMNGIVLNLYSKENNLISQIEITNTIKLEQNENYLIANDLDTETRIGRVEYKIGK